MTAFILRDYLPALAVYALVMLFGVACMVTRRGGRDG